jgi:hypothetical protein
MQALQALIDLVTQYDIAPTASALVGGYVILQFVMKVVKFVIQTAIICGALAGGLPAVYHMFTLG